MNDFLSKWGEAANTSLGFFWMALWAFALGYVISSCIQVFVTENECKKQWAKRNLRECYWGLFLDL